MDDKVTRVPLFGWRVKLDHKFPETWSEKIKPSFRQILTLIPLFIRMIIFYIWAYLRGVKRTTNFFKPVRSHQWSGVPFGGIGGGTVGRGFRGQFCHYQMVPGMYEMSVVSANQFIVNIQDEDQVTLYQKVLSAECKPEDGSLKAWEWDYPGSNAEYIALYPRSWTVYNIPEQKIKLTCRQISPVFPHNYKDTTLPGGVFVWTVENNSGETRHVSITFTYKNGTGTKDDRKGGCWSEQFEKSEGTTYAMGVLIHQRLENMSCTYAVSANKKDNVSVTRTTKFDPKSNGKSLWDELTRYGELESSEAKSLPTRSGQELACAVCAKIEVPTGEKKDLEFSLVWDIPIIHFKSKKRTFVRYYTNYFGKNGNSAPKMSAYALANFPEWEQEIYKWQQPILEDMGLPDWYKSALLNETYYVADGGTIWVLMDNPEQLAKNDPRREYGRFAYLEGHEYVMYNTYDVHFYSSFALAHLWPKLEASIQYEYRDTIFAEDKSKMWYLYTGKFGYRKYKNTLPHDLGEPGVQPFDVLNSYNAHEISEWRDLNLKYVLQCYRNYAMFNDKQYLEDMWPQLTSVMDKSLTFDTDGDGMIENGGFPDQTYDCWIMNGTSAYCGSLWLASLCCMTRAANLLNQSYYEEKYGELLKRATIAYNKKLWNGQYYNFDCSQDGHAKSIMSDQLCGIWYLRASGIDDEILPPANIKSALQTLYDMNVKSYCNGGMGAVNGMMPDRTVDTFAFQAEEMWAGVAYGLAALMIHEGKIEEGFNTARGIYDTVFNKIGLGFSTPEALHAKKVYRSIYYMRPLSIWAMQLAWESRAKKN